MHSQHAQRPGSGLTGVSIPTTSTRCSFARSPCRVATRSRTASLLSIRSNHQTPTSARSARPVVAAAAQQEQRASCSGRQLNAGSSAPAVVSPCQSPAAPAAPLQDLWSLASARLLGEGHSALLSVTLAAGMGGMLGACVEGLLSSRCFCLAAWSVVSSDPPPAAATTTCCAYARHEVVWLAGMHVR